MAFSIRFKNLDKVLRKLESLPDEVSRQILKQGLSQALEPMADEVRRTAPVRTGALRDAVRVTKARNKKGHVFANVRVGAQWFKGDQFYASFLVFGFRRNGIVHPPNNWMRAAFKAKAEEVRTRAVEIIETAVDAALAK